MNFVRILNVLAILAFIAAAVIVYRIKYESARQAEEVARLERQIANEKAGIAVLEAEWAYLSRPDRVQSLAAKNLDLTVPDSRQNVPVSSLPMRPAKVDVIGDTIASLTSEPMPVQSAPEDDPIGRTIEAMGLSSPTPEERMDRTMRALRGHSEWGAQ